MRGSRRDKIHPRGNPAIVTSIPAIFPQHSYPHPRETRGLRGIPAVPIPVHTSSSVHEKIRTPAAGGVAAMYCVLQPYWSTGAAS